MPEMYKKIRRQIQSTAEPVTCLGPLGGVRTPSIGLEIYDSALCIKRTSVHPGANPITVEVRSFAHAEAIGERLTYRFGPQSCKFGARSTEGRPLEAIRIPS